MRVSRGKLKRGAAALIVAALLLPSLWVAAKLAKSPHSSLWAPSYFRDLVAGRYSHAEETTDLFFLMCDHWEPGYGAKNIGAATEWLDRYKEIAREHHDSDGRRFQYTWYYPVDNIEEPVLNQLAQAAYEGFGETEVHWHHYHDSPVAFEQDLKAGLAIFMRQGALIDSVGSAPRWSFIHGNWSLDGSIPGKCGVSQEIEIMQRNGCYADFTFPAPGTLGQPSTINRIYYTHDTPESKSYDQGVVARVGVDGDGFLMFPGPIALDFRNPLILIENTAIDDAAGTGFSGKLRKPDNYRDYFKPSRIQLWNEIHIGVEGKPEWVFVKAHAHGMQNTEELLDGQLDAVLDALESYCESRSIRLHYITAREAFNLVKAAERELPGMPADHYDLVIPQPLNRRVKF